MFRTDATWLLDQDTLVWTTRYKNCTLQLDVIAGLASVTKGNKQVYRTFPWMTYAHLCHSWCEKIARHIDNMPGGPYVHPETEL